MSYMIPPVTLEVVGWFVIGALLSIVFHEAGHYFTADKMRLQPDLEGLTVVTKKDGTPKQQLKIISNAVMLGFLPIAALVLVVGVWALFIIPLYLLGCKKDFVMYGEISRYIKDIRRGGK